MAHLLVIDDEQSICWGLSKLGQSMGHTVAVASSAEEGFALAAEHRPDAIVLDVRLPGMDGLSALEKFRAEIGAVPIIVITAYGELATAVKAVRSGAFDYLVKPFDLQIAERAIKRAVEVPGRPCGAPPLPCQDPREEIIGTSPPMQEVFKRIALVAPSDACVHLRGESGTGKELVARAIHRYSRRAQGPFVAVSIAALAPSVAESELFGHVRGAFTGAEQTHPGLLQRAHGGTIFFDEVADIPASLQAKLLRVLEYGEVMPVGGTRPIQSDFRVISATHQNLYQRVCEGAFRHDLYFRLVTFEIELPPLRQRRQDIAALTDHFLALFAAKNSCPRPEVPPDTRKVLESRDWWGNVRELRNALEHAMILARGGPILPDHLPPLLPPRDREGTWDHMLASMVRKWAESQLQRPSDSARLYEQLLQVIEPPLFEAVLQRHHGQFASAARQLGLHRVTLKKKMDQYRATR